jgi:hypothetical protein
MGQTPQRFALGGSANHWLSLHLAGSRCRFDLRAILSFEKIVFYGLKKALNCMERAKELTARLLTLKRKPPVIHVFSSRSI